MRKICAALVALTIGLLLVALWVLRYTLFAILMFLRPLCGFVFGGAAALSLAALVFGLVIARDHHQMLWALFGAGLASSAILFAYDAILLTLAPSHFPIVLAR
jgi:glucan phosphoethanolaminetransferase (alkaline phosphatase superfamily)